MHFYFMYSSPPPVCPDRWGNKFENTDVAYPSAALVFAIVAITGLTLALLVSLKYNSVKVFNRKIRTQNISNTMWIFFYFAITLRSASNCVRYSLIPKFEQPIDAFFVLASLILFGISSFALCLALNHQRKFRSSMPPAQTKEGTGAKELDPVAAKYSWVRKTFTGAELLFFVLFLLYMIFLYLQVTRSSATFEILFLCAFALQRIPVVVLSALIAFTQRTADGPSRQSRIFLLIGAIINVSFDLPVSLWSYILPDNCVFVVASWVDLLHLLFLASLVLFFMFVRSEYRRNMEETIWNTVSQIQDFDFRRFN